MTELARSERGKDPLTSATIAERKGIPEKYLVHILLQLKRSGLVHSVRGAQGGYVIARPSEEITLLDIVTAIDGHILEPLPVDDANAQEMRPVWAEAATGIQAVFRNVTLRTILERINSNEMYYI